MKKVLILGASGMLGSMLLDYFSKQSDIELTVTARNVEFISANAARYHNVAWYNFDIIKDPDCMKLKTAVKHQDYVINAIGLVKQIIEEKEPEDVMSAISTNAILPYFLAKIMLKSTIIQIATDCVFSGIKGDYKEGAEQNPSDVYGKTKSLGEVNFPNIHHLRCSILGFDQDGRSLLSWFIGQKQGVAVNGYANHWWNGLTTLHFSKICLGIIRKDLHLPLLQHVVPDNVLSKEQILNVLAQYFKREDIIIRTKQTPVPVDRTLETSNEDVNSQLWESAGYKTPPTIEVMVKELVEYSEIRRGENS